MRGWGALRLILLGLIAPGSVIFGFQMHTAPEAQVLLQRFGYFTMMGTFAWWLIALSRLAREEGGVRRVFAPAAVRRHGSAWMIMGALVVVAWVTVPYSWKVLYDELVLQSTALNLHFFRELGTLVRGYEVEGVFRSLDIYLDKRPFFYPFLVSLVHDLTGYRSANPYVLNTLLMPVVLGLVYGVARMVAGQRPALVALTCFGASSLLALNANGTGMEMLNLTMFLLTLGWPFIILKSRRQSGFQPWCCRAFCWRRRATSRRFMSVVSVWW